MNLWTMLRRATGCGDKPVDQIETCHWPGDIPAARMWVHGAHARPREPPIAAMRLVGD